MGVRRKARELALKAIFEIEFSQSSSEQALVHLQQEKEHDEEIIGFTRELLEVYQEHSKEINRLIEDHSNNWKLSRMASVDRNVLRLGVTEIVFLHDIPKNVTINEYLEIAKKYGTEESSSFVNGILDKIQA